MAITIERHVDSIRSEDTYQRAYGRAVKHLIGQVEESGYMRASAIWRAYDPHWFRDSSIVAIALFTAYNDLKREDPELALKALAAGKRITSFNIRAIENFIPNIQRGLELCVQNQDYFKNKYHIPTKVGRDLGYYRGTLGSRDFERIYDDEQMEYNTGLRQNDSVPLVMLSIVNEARFSPLERSKGRALSDIIKIGLEYVGTNYPLESADAWEMEHGLIHSYNVAAADVAFQSARFFARNGIVKISEGEISAFERLNRDCPDGPIEFLKKYFIKEGVIYRSKVPFGRIVMENGVDGTLAHMLTLFEISDKVIGLSGVERKTMEVVERDLFGGRADKEKPNVLPLRVSFEAYNYFGDGRWLPVGLSFAVYYLNNGEVEKAKSIIDHVVNQWEERTGVYSKGLPEQELIDVMNPKEDHGGYLNANDGKPIEDLAWSYAGLILAISRYEEVKRGEPLIQILRT